MTSAIKDVAELYVFGAGQMRTGTMSLQVALEHLYKGKCYHMEEVFKNQSHAELWQTCANKRELSQEIADQIFRGYVAAVDFPPSIFYRDLLELYPKAKVILTVRDPDSWVKSVKQTTMRKRESNFFIDSILYVTGSDKLFKMPRSLFKVGYQRTYEELEENDELLRESFIKFNEDVKKNVPEDRLLIFEAKQGWEPLCRFLGKDVPDIPYPKVNNTDEYHVRIWNVIIRSFVKVLVPVSVVGVMGIVLESYFLFR